VQNDNKVKVLGSVPNLNFQRLIKFYRCWTLIETIFLFRTTLHLPVKFDGENQLNCQDAGGSCRVLRFQNGSNSAYDVRIPDPLAGLRFVQCVSCVSFTFVLFGFSSQLSVAVFFASITSCKSEKKQDEKRPVSFEEKNDSSQLS